MTEAKRYQRHTIYNYTLSLDKNDQLLAVRS